MTVDKTYNKTCVTIKDSNQPIHPSSMARLLFYTSLDSPEAVEGTCDQQRLIIDFLLCWELMTHQPLWFILCCLPDKGRKEIAEEMKERTRKKEEQE